jgi:methylmalonyl-CoA mutase, C-terminal domain
VLIHWLREQGMEVIYTGLRQSVDQVLRAALQEDVDVIGISILSGSHLSIAGKLLRGMKEKGMEDTLLLFGGIIPKEDWKALKGMGVHGVFPPHSDLNAIVDFIREQVRPESSR